MGIFRKLSTLELATRELDEAKRAKMVAQTGVDWAQCSVNYNNARIVRLLVTIKEEQEAAQIVQDNKDLK
jgi:hypothetical protein